LTIMILSVMEQVVRKGLKEENETVAGTRTYSKAFDQAAKRQPGKNYSIFGDTRINLCLERIITLISDFSHN
ncbi:MAG: hypothetical protein ACYC4E_02930, partial [Carboxydocellales bacterium]